MARQQRITSTCPGPDIPDVDSFAGSVTSFRSNIDPAFYAVGVTDGDPEGLLADDGGLIVYVDRRSALDLAAHFVEIANSLTEGQLDQVQLLTEGQLTTRVSNAYDLGRDSEQQDRDKVAELAAAKLREVANSLWDTHSEQQDRDQVAVLGAARLREVADSLWYTYSGYTHSE